MEHQSWPNAFDMWKRLTEYTPEIECLSDNMQLLRECKDIRDSHFHNWDQQTSHLISDNILNAIHITKEDDLTAGVDEEVLHDLLQSMDEHVSKSVNDSEKDASNVLPCFENSRLCSDLIGTLQHAFDGMEEDITQVLSTYKAGWKEAYNERKSAWHEKESQLNDDYDIGPTLKNFGFTSLGTSGHNPHLVSISPQSSLAGPSNEVNATGVINTPVTLDINEFTKSWGLNTEQMAAFNIITNRSLDFRGFGEPLVYFCLGQQGQVKVTFLMHSKLILMLKEKLEYFMSVHS